MLLNGINCVAIKEISDQTNEKQNLYFDVSRFNCKKTFVLQKRRTCRDHL